MEIGGATTASEFGYMNKRFHATMDEIRDHADTRLNIIDEISFAGYTEVLENVSLFLQNATECREYTYGKAAICFLGDFCQLQAIQKDMLYDRPGGIFWEQSVNCMVELKGTHWYRDCPLYGRIMTEIRSHGLSDKNGKILNERVIDGDKVKMPNPSDKSGTGMNARLETPEYKSMV